jgi:hypothetical protein
MSLLKILGEV